MKHDVPFHLNNISFVFHALYSRNKNEVTVICITVTRIKKKFVKIMAMKEIIAYIYAIEISG